MLWVSSYYSILIIYFFYLRELGVPVLYRIINTIKPYRYLVPYGYQEKIGRYGTATCRKSVLLDLPPAEENKASRTAPHTATISISQT